ncbi:MAG: beta-fructofuranosidase [Thermomicrobiales bacterium]|nr:beta-fructofuranosidase [Thermomicrobiales bacterium]
MSERPSPIVTGLREQDLAGYQRVAAAARAELQRDPHRPQYHFTPPANWMNDPNGLIQWNGRYHLFYQHHPHGPLWAEMHWGHAVSDDLLHWQDLPVALAPTPDTCDRDGIFSGCTVDDGGTPTILYTGVDGPNQAVCVATGDDALLRWTKDPANPVVPQGPPDLDLLRTADCTHFRDPSVWWEGDRWQMLVGSGIRGAGGTVLRYSSPDLRHWTFEGPLLIGDEHAHDPVWTGSMWECPQLFPLADRHVLMISVWHEGRTHYPAAMIGIYADGRFVPESAAVLDAGSHYAPQTFLDDRGRRLLIGWLREQRSREAQALSGWNGVMSIPWVLSLGADRRLRYAPASELAALRHAHQRVEKQVLPADQDLLFPDLGGDVIELSAELAPEGANALGLVVRRTPDGTEETRIVYEPARCCIFVDRTRSSLDDRSDTTRHEAHLQLHAGEPLRLRVFLDRSVLELVANERLILSERIYPTREASQEVGIFASGGPARLLALDRWAMRSIW